ncbi:S26 family signal peptidase [Actinokineospora enzanensis]|uniref:S26 family signal peptidase n=1 Tax=Actinokineospora enzanensis TaxID=155975 RepID=UPI00036D8644|nr:S26 family signal peptidase [Actinokineospora enzanensis]
MDVQLLIRVRALVASQHPERRGRHRAALVRAHGHTLTVLATLLLVGVIVALSWRVTGGRWLSVDTPSMGEAAPVGTLVLTRPTHIADLRVGDVISFTPAGGGQIHTHRVIRLSSDAAYTKGDINGALDPSPVRDADLVGKVVARWWGLAWLIKALPFLIPGCALVWLLTRWAGARWRTALRLVGYPIVLAVAIVALRPLVSATLLTTMGGEDGTRATVVATGILPVRVQTPDGVFADLHAGQVADLLSKAADDHGRVPIAIDAHMPWQWWTVCLALCAVPLLVAVYRLRRLRS